MGTLGGATAYRWYGVGENVATYTTGPLAQPPSARASDAPLSQERVSCKSVRPGSLRVFQRVLIPVLRAVIHVPVELATCLHVDVVCPQAADSHSPASSIVPERLSEDAASVFQRSLTVRGRQGFVAITRLYLPPLTSQGEPPRRLFLAESTIVAARLTDHDDPCEVL
jgi:hypothetical protein